ncbi:hypothetical protein [Streptomyces sp. NRRL F-5123]|uniref:hypothetical protein n=1 Tax=Streptomyces sp. NRRL F-5123 TaxID=1463856 RepID=UPI00131D5F3E|nr:hypothetical protein [Streptomyces sp. NRRL F-5123]
MSDVTASVEAAEEVRPVELAADLLDEQLIGRLVGRARAGGLVPRVVAPGERAS